MPPEGCDKNGYPSRRAAKKAARIRSDKGGEPLRVYPCPNCGQWHMTSLMRSAGEPAPLPRVRANIRRPPVRSIEELEERAAALRAKATKKD